MARGQHLVVDLEGCAVDRIQDPARMEALLEQLSADCGLTICSGPHLVPFTPVGLTGFVVLKESHVAFHTYPEARAVAFDLYSCSPVPRRRVLATLKAALEPTRMRSQLILRAASASSPSPSRAASPRRRR
jgi:S-adenosylmethionine decarboxylase